MLDGILGRPGEIQGIQLGEVDEREILYLAPTLFYNLTPSTLLEVGVRIPLQGKNYPAGSPIQIGLFRRGSFWN